MIKLSKKTHPVKEPSLGYAPYEALSLGQERPSQTQLFGSWEFSHMENVEESRVAY